MQILGLILCLVLFAANFVLIPARNEQIDEMLGRHQEIDTNEKGEKNDYAKHL